MVKNNINIWLIKQEKEKEKKKDDLSNILLGSPLHYPHSSSLLTPLHSSSPTHYHCLLPCNWPFQSFEFDLFAMLLSDARNYNIMFEKRYIIER